MQSHCMYLRLENIKMEEKVTTKCRFSLCFLGSEDKASLIVDAESVKPSELTTSLIKPREVKTGKIKNSCSQIVWQIDHEVLHMGC